MISKKFGPRASSARRFVPATPSIASTTRPINSEASGSSHPDSPTQNRRLRTQSRSATGSAARGDAENLAVAACPAAETRQGLARASERVATPDRGCPNPSRQPHGLSRRLRASPRARKVAFNAQTGDLCAFLHTTPRAEASIAHAGGPVAFPRRRSLRQDSSTSPGVTSLVRFRALARRARRATTARPEPIPPPNLDDVRLKHATDAPMGTFRVRFDVDRVT